MSEPGSSVDVAETHISWVFFTPERAYKLLKPVTMPFLDLADRATRLESVAREFELNHEISPDVYLGTSDIVEDGTVVDRMLVMRRLPAERRLSALVDNPSFEMCLRGVARVVAALHARREPVHDAPMARRDALMRNWQENFDAIGDHVDDVIPSEDHDRAETLVRAYLHRRDVLLDGRLADGFVRDVHGDLTAEDIFCLDDGPRIIDCLAFNDRWRIVDVLSDIGFLIMDVHRLAGWRSAERLMRLYQEFSAEKHPSSLAHHYVAYRAHVRCKVACFRIAQGDADSAPLARRYHELTLDHLERARLRVVLVGGGPGAGKTTLATGLGAYFGFPVLASDEIRKDLTHTPRDEHRFAAPGQGIYDAATTASAYDELRREAELIVRAGSGVVLDATWTRDADRRAVRLMADELGAEIVEVECRVAPEIARARIGRRLTSPTNTSDATPELVDYLAGQREPWPEAVVIDTEPRVEQVTAAAVSAIARRPVGRP